MMTRLSLPLLAVLLGAVPTCGGPADAPEDPGGPGGTRWIDDGDLFSTGMGRVSFVANDGNALTAYVYRSTGFEPTTGPVWFVMHGADRDADRYIRIAAPVAERWDALAIAIHFSRDAYPTGDDYTLGIEAGGGVFREPADMLYSEIEYVFGLVRRSLGGRQGGYYLFGHSAGAQFTHRLLTFLPETRVLRAVAANAGWYTLPAAENPQVHAMPYGLIGAPVSPGSLAGLFDTPLAILLGENDTATAATDDLLRGTPEANAQGSNRLERGRHYFTVGEAQSSTLLTGFAWRLHVVPRAEHDAAQVMPSAGFLTFDPIAEPCTGSPAAAAAGIVITEILADPPDSLAGDANGDGVRDPGEDEFVELVNQGAGPVCLTGWALGDAGSTQRHIFPLGASLAPGEVLIVFGGGVPTGPFGGARVQWAAHGLSLQQAGDVITVRSVENEVVRRVSWGDCSGATCAADHWPGTLDIDGSLTRAPDPSGPWAPHRTVAGAPYSPGVAPGAAP